MADVGEDTGSRGPVSGPSSEPAGAPGREPGWYALGANPNEQSYWDGVRWSGVRHWTPGKGWVDGSNAQASGAPHLSANPYAPAAPPRTRTAPVPTPATFSLAVLLTVVSGIALMFGSVGTWVQIKGTVEVVNFHVSIQGLDQAISTLIGVNGYVTFIGGIVVLVLGGLALSSEERLLLILTTVVSLAVLVFAIYDMFRIVQKISQVPASGNPGVSVGWGLICVLSAAVLAMIVSLARLLGQR